MSDYNYLQPGCEGAIMETNTIRDLGIIISSNGDFSDHIEMIVRKVKQRIGWVFRAFQTNTIEFAKFMWKGYIQGLLDYGSQVWAPVKSTQLLKLEILQKSYTNRIIDLSDCNYWEK